jgi:hypothetical protein
MKSIFHMRSMQLQDGGLYTALLMKVFAYLLALRLQAQGGFPKLTITKIGLDHGIGHFMIFEVDSAAQAPAPPMPKWLRTSSAASDRRTVLPLSSRQAG